MFLLFTDGCHDVAVIPNQSRNTTVLFLYHMHHMTYTAKTACQIVRYSDEMSNHLDCGVPLLEHFLFVPKIFIASEIPGPLSREETSCSHRPSFHRSNRGLFSSYLWAQFPSLGE